MQKEHYFYLIVFQGIGPAILNFFINAGIAMVIFSSVKVIPLWGTQSIMVDFLGTIFILTFITSLIATPMTHKTLAAGKLPVTNWKRNSHFLFSKLPDKLFPRTIIFSIIFFLIFSPITIFSITISGIQEMILQDFIIFKGIFAAILAAIITPIITLAALGDEI